MGIKSKYTGFTLVELLVAMAVASIVMAAIYATYVSQVRGKIMQEMMTEMQQGARAALMIMEKEIRMAGCDPTGNAVNAGIETAGPAELRFSMDVRGDLAGENQPDGMVTGPEEDIRYALSNDADGDGIADGTPCHLRRQRMPNGPPDPICRNVDALNFVYLDADGVVLDPVGTPADRNRIRSVQLTIVARSGEQLRGLIRPPVNNTVYRNQQGDVILPAQGDNFIRLMSSTTIKVRNLGL